jgi:16S rRNA (guanine966-N2)-methyltransferase
MRVTGGEFKGRVLKSSPGSHVRPTTDIAREGFFNILQHSLDWEDVAFLDLFSGTGIMSLEALSRGCATVLSVDKHPKSVAFIKQLRHDFLAPSDCHRWETQQGDGLVWSKSALHAFDLIYADPPYDWPHYVMFVEQCLDNMKAGSLLCVEHQKQLVLKNSNLERARSYGQSVISFFRK